MLGVVIAIILSAMIPQWRESKRRLAKIWVRPCAGREWRLHFPDAPKTEIRKFLTLFTDSFGFGDEKRLQFKPTDTIIEIYQALYPQQGWPDALEMETFAMRIEETYKCTITEDWKFSEMTLGELFRRLRSPNHVSEATSLRSAPQH